MSGGELDVKNTQDAAACGSGHSHVRVGDVDGDSPFEALPTRVRQRLKSQPRTTRAGTGKSRIVACLDEEEGARSFRRRKPSQRPKVVLTDTNVDGAARRFEQDFHGRKTREVAKSSAKALAMARPAKAARSGDDLDAGRFTHAPKSRVVGGRRVAPSRHRASPSRPATPDVNGSHPHVPANLAAAGFSPFKAVRRPRPGSEFRHTAWEQTGCYQPCKDMFEALGREVRDYVSYRNTCMAVLAPRVEAEIQALRRVVVSTFDWCSLEVYGSFASGLWLPGSDVDLVALALTQDAAARAPAPVYCLYRVMEALQPLPWVANVQVISSAKMPVMKVKTTSGLSMDVTFADGGTVGHPTTGVHNGLATLSVVRQCCDAYPEVRPLALVLKQFLREQGLNEAFSGGLSSYSVVLMTTAFLQMWGHETGCAPFLLDVRRALCVQAPTAARLRARRRTPASAPADAGAPQRPPKLHVVTTSPQKDEVPSPSGRGLPPQMSPKSAAGGEGPPGDGFDTVAAASKPRGRSFTADELPSARAAELGDALFDDDAAASVGQLLMNLLQYFGAHFRSDVYGLSVRQGGFYFALPPPPPTVGPDGRATACAPKTLVMEDPLAPGHNVAASSFNFQRVASVLEDAYFALTAFRPTQFKPTLLSCLLHRSGWATTMSVLDNIDLPKPTPASSSVHVKDAATAFRLKGRAQRTEKTDAPLSVPNAASESTEDSAPLVEHAVAAC